MVTLDFDGFDQLSNDRNTLEADVIQPSVRMTKGPDA